jgi:hypothetical protein
MPDQVTIQIPATSWNGPFEKADQDTALAALEAGRVIIFPHLPFGLEQAEAGLLSAGALDETRKNISADPATGVVHGTALAGAELAALTAMLTRFRGQAEGLVRHLLPGYAAALSTARTSFRPAEIAGRETAPRKDDKRLHVDAFPTRPMRGRRILRVFTNVAMDGTKRVWRVGEPFADFAQKFLPRVRPGFAGQALLMERLGLTKGRRAPYDFLMLGLHDAAKLDSDYQTSAPAAEVTFAPGTTWMCFTDSVLHAAMAGRCALEQTFHIPVAAMASPERAPLRVLESLTGRPLA